ncbi:MAG: hypothetical protein H8E63_09605 [Proteobacteria bacterium]|nr:hypothetical protein [Pseudomonadota bacterium]
MSCKFGLGPPNPVPGMCVLRGESPASLVVAVESVRLDTATNEYRVVAGEGDGPLWVGWQPSTEKEAGLQVRSVGGSTNSADAVALRD